MINDGALIIKHSKLKIKTVKVTLRGSWYPEWGISVQGVDLNHDMREIVAQCQKNNIRIKMPRLRYDNSFFINSFFINSNCKVIYVNKYAIQNRIH